MKSPYINIHSHQEIMDPILGIQSYFVQEITMAMDFPKAFSVGLHPWHLNIKKPESYLSILESLCGNTDMLAIGECGLDRAVSVNYDLQLSIFQAQLDLAEQNGKALIVHNVRAFSDFLAILKTASPSIPIIFHGFSGNYEIMTKMLHYNVYFSFGHDLFNDNSKASRIIQQIPLSRLFLETDDWSGNIEEIYQIAAQRLQIGEDELRNQIYYSYKSLFS